MTQLPADEAIVRFKENEDRFNQFVNSDEGYTSSGGEAVESIPAFLERVESEIGATGAIAITEANKVAAQSAQTAAESANTSAQSAKTNAESARDAAIVAKNEAIGAASAAANGLVGKATRADLYADLAHADGTIAYVTNDPTAAYNGVYRKSGANGSGSWAISNNDIAALALAVAKRGRIMFTVSRQSTFDYSQSGTQNFSVGWNTILFLKGDTEVRRIANRTLADLPIGDALYIDIATDLGASTDYPVSQAGYTTIAADVIAGSKVLLVANYFGILIGELAQCFKDKFLSDSLTALVSANSSAITAAQLNSERARKFVTGRVSAATWSGSTLTVTLTEGCLLRENGGVTKIAPVSATSLATYEGLIVDFTSGAKDGEGRYIPVKGLIPSAAYAGWQTGNKYVLAANGGFSNIIGEYNDKQDTGIAPGVYDGMAAFSTNAGVQLPTWNPTTRTLSWPELVLVVKSSVRQNRIKLEAGSIVFPSGYYNVAALNLAQVNNTLTPASAVSVGTYFQGGWNGNDVNYMPLFAVSGDVSYPLCFPPTIGSTTYGGGSSGETSAYQNDELVVLKRADEMDIFMKGSNPTSNKYLRYRMQRKPNVEINSDVWRWNEVWEVQRTGEFTFSNIRQICNPGENELAIRQTGKADFMGGTAHGDEELFTVTALIDGSVTTLGETGQYRCRRVEFLQASNLYEEGTNKANLVAKDYRRIVFEAGEVELFHNIVWQASINLEDSYLTMLTLLRMNGATQISDKGYRSPLYLEEDISVADFTPTNTKSNIAKASGPNGYSAEVEILEGWDKANREFNFSNSTSYNKFYFDFTGPNYQTQIGEVFSSRTRYKLDTKN